ncbi:MAG: hypothetical protein M3R38_08105 [Actinomycetota bacterium]|nr:hypothetical protein [Actinomycetota bacterium]
MSFERRLRKLESEHAEPEEAAAEREESRKRIREQAEHANYCRAPEPPIFEIAENGDVFCARDGRPVTDTRQTLAEEFYWMEVGFGGAGLVHDEEAQAFYSKSGHLAVSRDRVDLRYLMGPGRHEH